MDKEAAGGQRSKELMKQQRIEMQLAPGPATAPKVPAQGPGGLYSTLYGLGGSYKAL